jgi:hypothetical protein
MRRHFALILLAFSISLQPAVATEATQKPTKKAVKSSARKVQPIVVKNPPAKPAPTVTPSVKPKDIVYFTLEKDPAKANGLVLKFNSLDPAFELNSRARMTLDLKYTAPLKLSRSLFTRIDWPQDGKGIRLTYSGDLTPSSRYIRGKARFQVCGKKTKVCKDKKSEFELVISQ